MRTLLIGALCATLIGCSCPAPPRGMLETCTSKGCFYRTPASTPTEPKHAHFKPAPAKITGTPKKVAKVATPTAAKPPNEPRPLEEKANSRTIAKPAPSPPVRAKTGGPASAQPAETSDPVLKKAMTTTAANLEDPASAEFGDMKRAIRKDAFGQPIDTICGHVSGKKASGEHTGERSFLYLVKEDKAFVDEGNPDSAAAIAYRTICTSPDLH